MTTLKLDSTQGALPVSFPRPARLPSNVADLDCMTPQLLSLVDLCSKKERVAYIASLIAESLGQ